MTERWSAAEHKEASQVPSLEGGHRRSFLLFPRVCNRLMFLLRAGAGYPAARDCNLANKSLHQSGWSTQPVPAAGSAAVLIKSPAVKDIGGSGCLTMEAHGWSGGVGECCPFSCLVCGAFLAQSSL